MPVCDSAGRQLQPIVLDLLIGTYNELYNVGWILKNVGQDYKGHKRTTKMGLSLESVHLLLHLDKNVTLLYRDMAE